MTDTVFEVEKVPRTAYRFRMGSLTNNSPNNRHWSGFEIFGVSSNGNISLFSKRSGAIVSTAPPFKNGLAQQPLLIGPLVYREKQLPVERVALET